MLSSASALLATKPEENDDWRPLIRESSMPRYMLQFSYTAEAWKTLTQNPQDRSKGIADLIQKLGGKLHSLDYCLGDFDGIAIIELPDSTAINAAVFAAISPGHL